MRKDLDQLFDEFMYESEFVRKVSKDTLRGYLNTYTLFRKILPTYSLDTISSAAIIDFFKLLQERKRIVGKGIVKIGIKKSTVASYWGKLHGFFSWLTVKGYISTNPFQNLTYPIHTYDDRKFLKKEEVEKIIAAVHVHHNNNILLLKRNLVLIYLLLFCGLRKKELLLLQIRDIDFERKCLTIRADTSKSGRSRQLPLHSSLIMYLKDYLTARKSYTSPFLLVSSQRDERLLEQGLINLIQKIKLRSGVSFHLHQFRHTFAVNFLKASRDIAKLRQLLGHKSLSMTLLYLRCLPTDEIRKDIESMSIDTLI